MKKTYPGVPMRFAHTGVTQFAPENTLEAFQKAAELGFEGIELNVDAPGRSPHALSMETTDAEYREIRALSEISEEHEMAVLELGMNVPGLVARLFLRAGRALDPGQAVRCPSSGDASMATVTGRRR